MDSGAVREGLTDEVVATLEQMVQFCRILEIEGQGDRTLGFASVRDPHGKGFWIKRSQIALGEVVDHRDFFHIGLDGKIYSGEGRCHGEWVIHAAIFARRPDIMALAHTHPVYGCIVSASAEPMRPVGYRATFFPKPPPRYEGSSELITRLEVADRVADVMGDHFAVFLRNHGVVFGGTSIEHALVIGTSLEEACRDHLLATSSNMPWMWAPDAEQARKIAGQERNLRPFWDYYCRKLARAEAAGHMTLARDRVPVPAPRR